MFSNMKLYKILFLRGGLKLVIYYFLNCHMFDLVKRTDTHQMLSKADMKVDSNNFEQSLMYMVSWTQTLNRAFKELTTIANIENYDFIDLGCGKGKACLIARKVELLGKSSLRYFGVDFESNLIAIAQENSIKIFKDEGNFIFEDVTKLDWKSFGEYLVVYLYNPFSSLIINEVLQQICDKKTIVLYTNPAEVETFMDLGYKVLYSKESWHANLNFKILTNHEFK